MARPTKYTPETVERICAAIQLGASYEHAAAAANVAYRTFAEWHAEKPQFAQAIKEAESKGVQTWLARIEQAANSGVWTAAAWKLERIYPHIYGRTIQEHTGLNGGPIEVADVSDRDRIASRMDELAERRRARELAQQPIRHGSEEAAV